MPFVTATKSTLFVHHNTTSDLLATKYVSIRPILLASRLYRSFEQQLFDTEFTLLSHHLRSHASLLKPSFSFIARQVSPSTHILLGYKLTVLLAPSHAISKAEIFLALGVDLDHDDADGTPAGVAHTTEEEKFHRLHTFPQHDFLGSTSTTPEIRALRSSELSINVAPFVPSHVPRGSLTHDFRCPRFHNLQSPPDLPCSSSDSPIFDLGRANLSPPSSSLPSSPIDPNDTTKILKVPPSLKSLVQLPAQENKAIPIVPPDERPSSKTTLRSKHQPPNECKTRSVMVPDVVIKVENADEDRDCVKRVKKTRRGRRGRRSKSNKKGRTLTLNTYQGLEPVSPLN